MTMHAQEQDSLMGGQGRRHSELDQSVASAYREISAATYLMFGSAP